MKPRFRRTSAPTMRTLLTAGAVTIFVGLVVAIVVAALIPRQSVSADSADLQSPPITSTPSQESDDSPMVTFLGDSYTSGSKMDSGADHRYPALVGEALGVRVRAAGFGAAGYVTPGTARKTFSGLLPRIHVDSDVVVIFGSRSDKDGYQPTYDAALQMYQSIRARFPEIVIVAVSPAPVEADIPQTITDDISAIHDAATAAGATFVDASTWLNSGTPGIIGKDHFHPTDAGHRHLAELFTPVVQAALESRTP
ncbi:SGNH/GDSL hydrolase family protein [Herbiconiux sp. P18]|uniref:SGNH/GDSL hydrolase family protein n=1 Tax=Herbiconiux liangxiaofengii TaxID=3342795 RepID=UPI003CF08C86